jgi:Na+/phosphate symporter
MIQSGIARVGRHLRRVLTAALDSRLKAFFAGIGVTALLQSRKAQRLMDDKSVFRAVETRVTGLYFEHVRGGRADGAESLRLDILHDPWRINGHLVAAVQPVLDGFSFSAQDAGQHAEQ